MKISKVGSPKEAASTRKKKSSAAPGEFADQVRGAGASGGADETAPPESVGGLGAVESLIALQEVPDATDGRSKGVVRQYGADLLDRLDELRLAILAGAVPKEKLAELAHSLRQKRQLSDDPRLNAIIDEIELRCEVEIAKLTRER